MTNAVNTSREEIGGLEGVIRPKWPNPISFTDDTTNRTEFDYDMNQPCEFTVADAQQVQSRDFDTKEPEVWPSGDPKMILVLGGTDSKTGERITVFFQGKEMNDALKNAMAVAKVTGVAMGDVYKVTWTGVHPTPAKKGSRAKLSPTKEYTVEITI